MCKKRSDMVGGEPRWLASATDRLPVTLVPACNARLPVQNRWANTWDTQVLVEVFGQQLKLQQDPNSYSHGTSEQRRRHSAPTRLQVAEPPVPILPPDAPAPHNALPAVWDASLVFAKYVERQRSSGDFCRARLRGKRALELGAGAGGVAGMALVLSGAHVALTDLQEVLPLLRANVSKNVTPAALSGAPPAAERC